MSRQSQVLAVCKGLTLFKNSLIDGYTVITPEGKSYFAIDDEEVERFIQNYEE